MDHRYPDNVPAGVMALLALSDEQTELTDGASFPEWAELGVFASPESPNERTRSKEPVLVDMRLEVRDGKPSITRLACSETPGGPEVTTSTLRGLKVPDLKEEAISLTLSFVWLSDRPPPGVTGAEARRQWVRDDEKKFAQTVSGADRSGRRRSVTDGLLRQVADVYREYQHGTPTKAVAEKLGTSHRNATRWIASAKQRGFITDEENDQ